MDISSPKLDRPQVPVAAPERVQPARRPNGLLVFLGKLLADKRALIGLAYIALIALLGIFAPLLAPYPPTEQHLRSVLEGASSQYWFGTDDLGRDILSRMMYAGGVSLGAAMLAVSIGLLIGWPLGLISGYVGGWFDEVVMRVVDALQSFPHLVLALAITGVLGPDVTHAMFAVGVVFSPIIARLVRAQVMALRHEMYLDEARLLGAPHWWILARHIVPNTTSPVIIQTALLLGLALVAEASLSFLGLGVQPPDASWGVMLGDAYHYIRDQPLMMLPPAFAIAAAVLAFNLLGDALRDLLEVERK